MILKSIFPKWFLLLALLLTSVTGSFSQSTYWWNETVFYEVFVRSFKDSDGDGKGDLQGLMDKLDYLNDGDPTTNTDLGVTGIWLMPIQESPSYHGYDVTDYRTVEQDYGTNQDFKDFIAAAHSRGIKVIIDYVMNHTSSQHPFFVESAGSTTAAKRDWYVWEDINPGGTGPWGQQVWYPKNSSNYYAIFWSEMPDLNYTTEAVKDEMFDAARFWLEDMEVDGFRLDAVRYIVESGTTLQESTETIQFWEDFRTYYKSVDADAFAVGEAWAATEIAKGYVSDTTLDYCFEFDLASAILSTANTGSSTALTAQLNETMTSYPFLQFGTFLTNHDMNRTMDVLGNSMEKAKLAAELLLTLPGVPYLYYGEEIGMNGSGVDENKRRPLQWDKTAQAGFTSGTPWRVLPSDYTTKNIEAQQHEASSLWNKYRTLINLRKNQTALQKGAYKPVTSSVTSVFSFLRQYNTENILVVSNTSASEVTNAQLTLASAGIAPGTYTLVELQGGSPSTILIDGTGGFTNIAISSIPARSTFLYKLLDASAISTTVTFRIDMTAMIANSDFNPATESVDIVADFNNFGSPVTTLSDGDADGIYTVTISSMNIGSKLNYKYRINAANNGREEFSNSTYLREYLVLEGANTVTDTYQRLDLLTEIQTASAHAFSVYPVPADKELFLEYSGGLSGAIHYVITDLAGIEKISSSFTPNSFGQQRILCEGLPSGMYGLTLGYNGRKEFFKIVVQK